MARKAWEDAYAAVVELGADVIAAMKHVAMSGAVSAREFEVTYLYYWRGLNFEEIAEGLGISPDAVRRSHRKMLKALRNSELLEGYGYDE